jgi:hypothetical protein
MDVVPPQVVAGRGSWSSVRHCEDHITLRFGGACVCRACLALVSRWLWLGSPEPVTYCSRRPHGGGSPSAGSLNPLTILQFFSRGPIALQAATSGHLRGTFRDIEGDQLQRSVRSSTISLCNAITSSSFKSVLRSSCRCAQPRTMSCSFSWSNPGWPLVAAYSTTRRRQRSRSSIAAHSPP